MNKQYLERIADEWRERAGELADWTYAHLVNRTDVWGRYLPEKNRIDQGGNRNNAITAPFRDERGKVFLTKNSLQKHYKAKQGGSVLGIHSTGSDGSSRWFAIDIDLHDEDDLSVSREGNFVAARGWYEQLREMGFDPILMDSNGNGGFHLLVVLAEPMFVRSVRAFLENVVADYDRRGLDHAPDLFPGAFQGGHHGSWLRLPGRHHTREHYTRVYNDEPWADEAWLDGHDAIERILGIRATPADLLSKHGIERRMKTICLDFDGVIHSYTSGWKGETVIPDPPIHRVDQAIARLRKSYRVVIHSARCCTADGVKAIEDWLNRYSIEVDEVCTFKPPASIYVDDRAIPFSGDWDQTISDISNFRK